MGRKNSRHDLSGKQGHSDGIQPPVIKWDLYEPDPFEPPVVWASSGPELPPPDREPVRVVERQERREEGVPVGAEEVGLVGRSWNQPSRSTRLDTDTHVGEAHEDAGGDDPSGAEHPRFATDSRQANYRSWAHQCRRVILKVQRELHVEAGQHELGALRWIMAYATAHNDSSKRPVWILDPDDLTRERIIDGILLHVSGCRENVCAGLESAEAKKFWGDVMNIVNGPIPPVENARLRKRPYECLTCGKRFSESGLKGHQNSDDPRKVGHTGFKAHR